MRWGVLVSVWDDPAGNIERQYRERLEWNEGRIVEELRTMTALPPYRGRAWESEEPWAAAQLLVAHAAVAAERRLRSPLPLILDRMRLGDPGEMMRGMRHSLEAGVSHDLSLLAALCVAACSSANPGARYWAVQELGIVKECSTISSAVALLRDLESEVAEAACDTLVALAGSCPASRDAIIAELTRAQGQRPDIRHAVDKALGELTLEKGVV